MAEADIKFKNDEERLKDEFKIIQTKNKGLYNILLDVSTWIKQQFGKDTVVTAIGRTDAEQAEIYKNDPRYQQRAFRSPHQIWDAFDLRDNTFTKDEIPKIVKYLNDKYNGSNAYKWTMMDHTVGLGWHMHTQFREKAPSNQTDTVAVRMI